jgi:hypothetical protein
MLWCGHADRDYWTAALPMSPAGGQPCPQ